jgi:hypothetical protein
LSGRESLGRGNEFGGSRFPWPALWPSFVNFKLRLPLAASIQARGKLLLTHIDFFRIKISRFRFGLDVRRVHSLGRADRVFA